MSGPILPGATIGILGGGQLGRMMAMAARSLGYHIAALDPDSSCAARFVVDRCIAASFNDLDATVELARGVDVVTLEIEKISLASLDAAARLVPVRPGSSVLGVVQDRSRQKSWLENHGFPIGPWMLAGNADEVAHAARTFRAACFIKTTMGGYDGRGQVQISGPKEAAKAWQELGAPQAVVEKAVAIDAEISIFVARRPSGEMAVHPPALNHHVRRILEYSVMPAPISPRITKRAVEIARSIAAQLELEGVLAIEFFITKAGELLVNELAPRPHNTFHGTETGCLTSQFDQTIRAVCDLPLGSTEVLRPVAIHNLLGDLWNDHTPAFERVLALPGVRVHLYGKREARPGRKMGHLSAAGRTSQEAIDLVKRASRLLMA